MEASVKQRPAASQYIHLARVCPSEALPSRHRRVYVPPRRPEQWDVNSGFICAAQNKQKDDFFSCTSAHKSGFLGHTNKTDKQTSGPSERHAAQRDNSSRNSVRILSNLKATQRCRQGKKIRFNNLHGDLICRVSPLTRRSWGRGYQNQADHNFLILSLADYHLTTWTTLKPPTEKEMRRMCSASIQRKSGAVDRISR